mgnify:CR=1 FL=1
MFVAADGQRLAFVSAAVGADGVARGLLMFQLQGVQGDAYKWSWEPRGAQDFLWISGGCPGLVSIARRHPLVAGNASNWLQRLVSRFWLLTQNLEANRHAGVLRTL